MHTITFDENINLSKRHFKNLEELQMELLLREEQAELSPEIIEILAEREREADENPDNFLTLDELKRSIKRKNV